MLLLLLSQAVLLAFFRGALDLVRVLGVEAYLFVDRLLSLFREHVGGLLGHERLAFALRTHRRRGVGPELAPVRPVLWSVARELATCRDPGADLGSGGHRSLLGFGFCSSLLLPLPDRALVLALHSFPVGLFLECAPLCPVGMRVRHVHLDCWRRGRVVQVAVALEQAVLGERVVVVWEQDKVASS